MGEVTILLRRWSNVPTVVLSPHKKEPEPTAAPVHSNPAAAQEIGATRLSSFRTRAIVGNRQQTVNLARVEARQTEIEVRGVEFLQL